MSRGFVKEGDQEDIPVVTPRAFLPEGTTNYVTHTGLSLLKEEREKLMAKRESSSDNYIRRNYINATLALLEKRILSAVLQNEPACKDVVQFGAWVKYIIGHKNITVRIVGVDEADPIKGKISFLSPIAVALNGHKAGDEIEFTTPKGTEKGKILEISYDEHFEKNIQCIVPQYKNAKAIRVSDAKPIKVPHNTKTSPTTESQEKPSLNNCTPDNKEDAMEILPIVNERGIIVGRAQRHQVHNGSKILHPVVHLQVFNSAGEIYLQKRPAWKKIQPGKWDTAVGGHIAFGEKPQSALRREALEEIGIENFTVSKPKTYIWDSPAEKELVYSFETVYDNPITPSDETDGGRFWSIDEIRENLGKGIFTPNFEKEFKQMSL